MFGCGVVSLEGLGSGLEVLEEFDCGITVLRKLVCVARFSMRSFSSS
jgi:hypothetical protein